MLKKADAPTRDNPLMVSVFCPSYQRTVPRLVRGAHDLGYVILSQFSVNLERGGRFHSNLCSSMLVINLSIQPSRRR